VDYPLRFSGPVTPSPPAASGVEPDLICQPSTSPGIKTHSSPAAFPITPSLPFFPLLFTFLHRPTRSCLRLHRAPLTPCGPPSPTEPIRRGQSEKCRSVTGWLLFARRLGSIIFSTVWPVRRLLCNDAGEAPGVPAGRRRLGRATGLDAGLLLLPFKLRPPIYHTSRLHGGRSRPRQLVDWLRHHLLPISTAAGFSQGRD
jgi:hypothetical protein